MLDIQEPETIIAYKDWLQHEEGKAINTIKTKLSHVKTWLKQAYKVEAVTRFFRGQAEQVNPHPAYREEDIAELVRALEGIAEVKRYELNKM